MGLSIHYQLRFKGTPAQARKVLNRLGEIAEKIGFAEVQDGVSFVDYKTGFNDVDKHTPLNPDGEIDGGYRWAKIQGQPRAPYMEEWETEEMYAERLAKWERDRPVKHHSGYVKRIWFGEGCETTNLALVRCKREQVWSGEGFTKTQYAEDFVKAHTAVCALLRAGEKLGVVSEVSDEGDYYQTGDVTKLLDSLEGNWRVMEMLSKNIERAADCLDIKSPIILTGPATRATEELKKFSLEG